jgi:hypothetical protein
MAEGMNTGHGHVNPRPDGVKTRCGGPGICAECARDYVRKQERKGQPWPTGMRLHDGDNWDVLPDLHYGGTDDNPLLQYTRRADYQHGDISLVVPVARLRRVGWLDQKGRVWLTIPPGDEFDGGSLTPLLIDPGERTPRG